MCHPPNACNIPLFLLRDRSGMEADLHCAEDPFLQLESDYDPVVIAARRGSVNPARRLENTTETITPTEETVPHLSDPHEIVIMALGKTGDGKSSLLNDMLGRQVFKHKQAVQVGCKISQVVILVDNHQTR